MAFFDIIRLTPRSKIGSIEVQASIEEVATDTLQLTEHPVEIGAAITDHAYKRPAELVMRCGWSKNIEDKYSQLLQLQEDRVPFEIVTTKRLYKNMQIISLQSTTDAKTSQVLMVTITFRQIIVVFTRATSLAPRQDQRSPEQTAPVENQGTKQSTPATPSPGGAVSPANM